MNIRTLFIPLILLFVLAACSPSTPVATSEAIQSSSSNSASESVVSPPSSPTTEPTQPSQPTPTAEPTQFSSTDPTSGPSETEAPVSTAGDLARVDNQGAVEVSVTPVSLSNPEDTLIFEVSLNTHSVDLSMDLSTMAILTTDTGKSVQATSWDAPRGGHHVAGTLSFPAFVDGQPLLEGAKTLTLVIKNLDAPERVLSWDLSE